MDEQPKITAAFDRAIRQVERAIAGGLATRSGEPARPQLERLRAELVTHRQAAMGGGPVDRGWVGETVREVAGWAPDEEVALLAALGAIARGGGGR